MSKRTTLLAAAAVFVAVFVVVVGVTAQMLPGREGGGFSDFTPPPDMIGGPFPEAGQTDSFADLQAKIQASDEEWKVIGPKLRRVLVASAGAQAAIEELGTGAPGLLPGGPGGGPRGGPGNDSFEGPSDNGAFGQGGPGPGGFARGGPGPEGLGRGGRGPRGFGRGGFGPGGPPPGGFPGFGNRAVMQKLMELQTALTDPNSTCDQLREKTAAVRAARQKASAELTAARKDLLELLTLDQEATLVSLGYLD